jgi:sugar phosphate isomerase/epimerase
MLNEIGCNIVHPTHDTGEQYTRETYLELLPAYRRWGFGCVELSHVTHIDEADAEAVRDCAAGLGLGLWSIHSEHLNGAGQSALCQYLEVQAHCVRVSAALGVKVMVCHVPNVPPYAGDAGRDADILSRLADLTDARGLRLAVETGPPAAYLVEVVDRMGRLGVGINLDTGHTALLGEDPAQAARLIGRRLFTTHLQDNFGRNDDHQPPGLGRIAWRPLLCAIRDIGYAGPLMVELTGPGNKASRSVAELRDFPIENEILFTLGFLRGLAPEIE